MKKFLKLFLIPLSLVLFAGMLIACTPQNNEEKEPETATELWDRIDKKMEALESYEMSSNIQMTFYVSGKKVTGTIVGGVIESNKDNDYYYYTDSSTTLSCPQLNLFQKENTIESYQNGTLFISTVNDSVNQQLYQDITIDEYKEFKSSITNTEFDIVDCADKEFEKSEDGTWLITLSGYTKKAIKSYTETTGIDKDLIGADILDINVKIKANSEYLVEEMEILFVFDAKENIPSVQAVSKYRSFNSAEQVSLSKNAYSEADILLIYELDDMLKAKQDKSSASFTYEITQTASSMGDEQSAVENDKVSYGTNGGKYFYIITSKYQNTIIEINYENGVRTIKQGTQSVTGAQSELEAKTYINSMINNMQYEKSYIKDAFYMEDGRCKIEFAYTDKEPYEQMLNKAFGMSCKAFVHYAYVTIENGEITSISNYVKAIADEENEIFFLYQTEIAFQD